MQANQKLHRQCATVPRNGQLVFKTFDRASLGYMALCSFISKAGIYCKILKPVLKIKLLRAEALSYFVSLMVLHAARDMDAPWIVVQREDHLGRGLKTILVWAWHSLPTCKGASHLICVHFIFLNLMCSLDTTVKCKVPFNSKIIKFKILHPGSCFPCLVSPQMLPYWVIWHSKIKRWEGMMHYCRIETLILTIL